MTASTRQHPLATASGYAAISSEALEARHLSASVTLADDLEANDVIELFKLPAEHTVRDAYIVADKLDTGVEDAMALPPTLGPAITLNVGVSDSIQDPNDSSDSDCFFSSSDVAQEGGTVRMSLKTGFRLAARPYDRVVTLSVVDAATIGATGRVDVHLIVVPKQPNGLDASVAMAT